MQRQIHGWPGMLQLAAWSASLAFVSALTGVPQAAAQSSLQGKTIRFVIASTASGPTDTMGRVFIPYLVKHLPGNPAIVPENRPGAAGVIAANYIYNAASKDGLTVGVLFGMAVQGFMQNKGVQYEPAKFNMLGAVSATQVLLARKDLGFSRPEDIARPSEPLILASLGTGSTTDAANRLFLEMLGVPYKYVPGYPGQAEAILAVARGEANLANSSHVVYLSRRASIQKEGVYDAFLQRGELRPDGTIIRNPQMPEIPTMVELLQQLKPDAVKSADFAAYRSILGALAVHYSFVTPPGTDPAMVKLLRAGFAAAMADPEALKDVPARIRAGYEFVTGEDSQQIVQKLQQEYSADPRIGERLKSIMEVK